MALLRFSINLCQYNNKRIFFFFFTDQHFAAADSNTTPAKSFVPCRVCGDKASGYHYGVTSCEGCKVYIDIITINLYFNINSRTCK